MALGYRGAGVAQGLLQGLPLAFNTYYQNQDRQRQMEEAEYQKSRRPLKEAGEAISIGSKAGPEGMRFLQSAYPSLAGPSAPQGPITTPGGLGSMYAADPATLERSRKAGQGIDPGALIRGAYEQKQRAAAQNTELREIRGLRSALIKATRNLENLQAFKAQVPADQQAAIDMKIAQQEQARQRLHAENVKRANQFMQTYGIGTDEFVRRLGALSAQEPQEEEE